MPNLESVTITITQKDVEDALNLAKRIEIAESENQVGYTKLITESPIKTKLREMGYGDFNVVFGGIINAKDDEEAYEFGSDGYVHALRFSNYCHRNVRGDKEAPGEATYTFRKMKYGAYTF